MIFLFAPFFADTLSLVLQSESERCAHLRKTINLLPPKHRDCLEFLMFHLARVASRERENLVRLFYSTRLFESTSLFLGPEMMKHMGELTMNVLQMSPKNLAVVFAPTIMRDHSLEKEMTDMHAKNVAVQFLIENSHVIFGES